MMMITIIVMLMMILILHQVGLSLRPRPCPRHPRRQDGADEAQKSYTSKSENYAENIVSVVTQNILFIRLFL